MAENHEDPRRLADELDRGADQLERRSAQVGEQIDQTRQEWQAKRADGSVPGANPPPRSEGDEAADDATGQGGPAGVGEPGSTADADAD